MIRRRLRALALLLLYGAAAVALPAVHLAHHVRHGADHHHLRDGSTVWDAQSGDDHDDDDGEYLGVEAHHREFDADLVALDLSDPFHAGIASVDCEFASYTLVDCSDPSAPPHTYGDELLARSHEHHHHDRTPFDPTHGAGSPEHFGLALLSPPTYLLRPPVRPASFLPFVPIAERRAQSAPLASRARGPPSPIVAA